MAELPKVTTLVCSAFLLSEAAKKEMDKSL